MNYTECIEQARGRIGSYCKACWECNGRACKNQMPGPGAKGIGDTAIRNYDKWKEIRVQMDTLVENRPCDTTLELFGRTFPPVRHPASLLLPETEPTAMSWSQRQKQSKTPADWEFRP